MHARPTAFLVALAASAFPVLAGTIHVAPCGDDAWNGTSDVCAAPNGPKRTIQAAINAAVNGDKITVAAGTYNEAINFNGKALHAHSEEGPETTIIDATGERPRLLRAGAIPVEDLDAVLADLELTVETEPTDA